MKNSKTPKPQSGHYEVEKPQKLNTPKFNSTTEKRNSEALPAVENMNDQQNNIDPESTSNTTIPETNLGNARKKDENKRERIIRK